MRRCHGAEPEIFGEKMMRSKYGMIGALIYLLIAGCTYAFSLSDKSMYSIAIFVLQGRPWVSFLPILLAILLRRQIILFMTRWMM